MVHKNGSIPAIIDLISLARFELLLRQLIRRWMVPPEGVDGLGRGWPGLFLVDRRGRLWSIAVVRCWLRQLV